MCGRYTLTVPLSNLVDAFDVPTPDFEYEARYNIAPTQSVPILAQGARGRRLGLLRWGLVPAWAKDPALGSRLINARSETAHEKPSFRSAFRRRRCLVPADGFFEWRKGGEGKGGRPPKTPFWIHLRGKEPFTFAGLWERWEGGEGAPLHTFTILTTDAAQGISHIHPRMPVILPPSARSAWLDPASDPSLLRGLLRPYEANDLRAYPVSDLVNSPRNDLPACIEPAQEGLSGGP